MTDKLGYALKQGDVLVFPGDAASKLYGIIDGESVVMFHKGNKDGSFPVSYIANRMVKYATEPLVIEPIVSVVSIDWKLDGIVAPQRRVEVLSEPCESCSA